MMKAFLLAAGVGSRLRPLTATIPKCLLPIGGQPLLDIWLDTFHRSGVDEVLVNVHHLAELVVDHVERRTAPPKVMIFSEPDLLGSAGTLAVNRQWVDGEDFFLVCNADNLTDFDLRALIDLHREGGSVATWTLFHSDRPSACGIVELDATGLVVGFVEKPQWPMSDLANAGMYAFSPAVLELIDVDDSKPRDIGFHLLPHLVGQARACLVDGYFRDIGTPEAYRVAQEEWSGRLVG